MNSFNEIFKIQIFGESHGDLVGVCIDNIPAGIALSEQDFETDLKRRRGGQQIGATPRVEPDIPKIKTGWFNGFTTGAPLLIWFENNNIRSGDYEKNRAIPRPGHADFVAHYKYKGYEDYRGGGHFSARLTAGIVAAGVIAKKILHSITVHAKVIAIAGEKDTEQGLQKAIRAKDSVGGIVECTIKNLPIGWGEPFWDSIESKIAHAIFAIPAVKGIEFGAGFAAASMFGSEHNDSIIDMEGTTATNYSGGIVGGISNGNDIVFRIAIKPTSSTPKPQKSLNWNTQQQEDFSIKGRHDLCVALRAPVIVEAMAAIVLADFLMIEKAKHQDNES